MIMKSITCGNTECAKVYQTKNPKKKFCGLICKNRAAYLFRQSHYSLEEKLAKKKKKNVKILEKLWLKKKTRVSTHDLNILDFDFDAPIMAFTDEEKMKVFRYENFGLKLIKQNEYELVKL